MSAVDISLNTWAVCAWDGRVGRSSVPIAVACIVLVLAHCTTNPLLVWDVLISGHEVGTKWPVAAVSRWPSCSGAFRSMVVGSALENGGGKFSCCMAADVDVDVGVKVSLGCGLRTD